jgi:uncharacterized protein (DUF4415 family)
MPDIYWGYINSVESMPKRKSSGEPKWLKGTGPSRRPRAKAKRIERTRLGKTPQVGTGAWVDPDEAPELTKEFFERADLYHGDKLIRRGRPPSASPKQALKLRIDADVVEYFRATGPGWQTRINDALRRVAKRKGRA